MLVYKINNNQFDGFSIGSKWNGIVGRDGKLKDGYFEISKAEHGKLLDAQGAGKVITYVNGKLTVKAAAKRAMSEGERKEAIKDNLRMKYTWDDEIALINNYNLYLADNTLTKYRDEYMEYQQVRKQAKQI